MESVIRWLNSKSVFHNHLISLRGAFYEGANEFVKSYAKIDWYAIGRTLILSYDVVAPRREEYSFVRFLNKKINVSNLEPLFVFIFYCFCYFFFFLIHYCHVFLPVYSSIISSSILSHRLFNHLLKVNRSLIKGFTIDMIENMIVLNDPRRRT